MHFARGSCGHLKAKWNNHSACMSCTSCLRSSQCSFCSVRSDKVWNLAEKRRLYSTRRSVMMQRRKWKKNMKRIQTKSDTGSPDGSTASPPLIALLLGAGPISGSPGDIVSDPAVSTSHRSTSHRSTSHRSSSHRSTSHLSTSHRSSSHQLTSHRSSIHQSTSQPGTCQPGTNHWSFTPDYQSPISISPITHWSLYLNTHMLLQLAVMFQMVVTADYLINKIGVMNTLTCKSCQTQLLLVVKSSHLSLTSRRCLTQVWW